MDGSAMSRIRRARLVLDLYFQMIIVIVVLTAAMVLEELDLRPGDVVSYECPQCGRKREQKCLKDPKQPISCDRDSRGRRHPMQEMTPLAIVKRA
jgi:hypothetical protein